MATDLGTPIGAIRRLYDVLTARDFAGTTALLDPDIVAETPAGQAYIGGRYHGPEAVITGIWGRLGQAWDPITPDVAELLDCGDGRVLALGRYHGVLKADGSVLDAPFAHLWTVRAGRVAGLRVFTDTAIWNKAWGHPLV